ncbi:transcriptional regulator, partial [Enterococcus faecium]
MLFLKEEKIIDKENVIGSNIRRVRLEKGIGQTELIRDGSVAK